MKLRNIFYILLTVILFSGCTTAPWITPPSTYSIINTGTYNKAYDEVWKNILGFVSENNIVLKNIDKENGLINAELTIFEDDVADCGKDSTMKVTNREATLNIFVNQVDNNVSISINNTFEESRQMMQAFETVTCNSKGVIEQRILDAANT